MELEDARIRSEMQARIDQLESEKQTLQLKLVRVADQFEKGDNQSKEKQLTYEEMLQESKRAYVQLDENYKSIIEKLQTEKTSGIKQFERTYQSKIKCKNKVIRLMQYIALEETVKALKQQSDDYKH